MNSVVIYCLIFALLKLLFVVPAMCKNHGPPGVKKTEIKNKSIQEDSQENASDVEMQDVRQSKTEMKEKEAARESSDTSRDLQKRPNKATENKKPKPKCKTSKSNTTTKGSASNASQSDAQVDKGKAINELNTKNDTDSSEIDLPIKFDSANKFSLPTDTTTRDQSDQTHAESEMAYNGFLYDVFKKRLNQVFHELYNNVNTPAVTQPPVQIEFENDKPKKRSAVSNCLYEEFKRRLDKFNMEFVEPAKAIKRTSSAIALSTADRANSDNLYEEYKKRLDKLGNELGFIGEKIYDRSGRDAPGMLPVTTSEAKCSKADKVEVQDFYEEYKRKLDELTRELYEESNERLCRTYGEVDERDLTSPTLQRLVATIQLDDAKAMPGNTRDAPGSFAGSAALLQIDKAIDKLNKQEDKRSLDAMDLGATIFGADSLNFMAGAANGMGSANGASYPAVLTKSADANLGLLGSTEPKNLLASVATKMNMTTLDLAKKLAAMSNPLDFVAKKDPQLGAEMHKFIDMAVHSKLEQNPSPQPNQAPSQNPSQTSVAKKSPLNEVTIVSGLPLLGPDSSGVPLPLMSHDAQPYGLISELTARSAHTAPSTPATTKTTMAPTPAQDQANNIGSPVRYPSTLANTQQPNEAEATRIAGVLDKVLTRLESLQSCKGKEDSFEDDSCEPDGMPCDIVGSWNSNQMGLRFDISLSKAADRRLGAAEKNNKLLSVEVGERVPPHAHHIIDTSWKFMGSALNQQGGPFYLYSQNRDLSIVATFVGYCRVCGAIDTIFGSWAIMGPSKDCEDVTTALENRRDIFRRYNMESKRNQRFKDMLFEKSAYGKSECDANKKG
ncbi:unnamed protein product [Ceratitis capitata]|uniref:(Mediterranean fruit fly) hypothetical protein n=1 Tax=Ceratitis capitata TaxID=7213 RepID=A0A811U7Z3_CERCA|nr:unnamed protein product [Ceratitis capitata]